MRRRARRRAAWLVPLLRRRGLVLGAYAAALAALAPGLLGLETDNSPRVFYLAGAPEVERFRAFQERFGAGDGARLVLAGEAVWSEAGLTWAGELEEAVAGLPGVARVAGPAGFLRGLGTPWPPADAGLLRQRLLASPLGREAGWVGAGGLPLTIVVELEELPAPEQRRLLAQIDARLAAAPEGIEAELVGLPALNRALDAASRQVEGRLFPLLVGISLGFLAVAFRQPATVVQPLLLVGACLVLTLGPMGYLGVRLNLVLAVLPPLLFAISLATAIHVVGRYRARREAGAGAVAATLGAYGEKARPVVWTGLTTMAGFATLGTSAVAPVRSLGLWTAWGLAATTVVVLTLLPVLLVSLPERRPRPVRLQARLATAGRRLAAGAVARRGTVVAVAAAVALVAAVGIGRLQPESNALTYLPADHPVRSAVERLEGAGIGAATVEVLLQPAPGRPPLDVTAPDALDALSELAARLRAEPAALGVVGPVEVIDGVVEETGLEVALGREGARRRVAGELLAEGRLAPFVAPLDGTVRLVVASSIVGLSELEPLLAAARLEAARLFPQAPVLLTGQLPLLLETQRYLLRTLGLSLGLTLLAVAALLRLLLRGTRLTLLALAANLWPVAGVLGVMGWLAVPLDIATVMVAAISLGLAVDATIHTLTELRRRPPATPPAEAIADTLERTAPAYVLTGAILAVGFGVCVLSDFAPIARFGGLTALAMVLALAANLLLVPALLATLGARRPG